MSVGIILPHLGSSQLAYLTIHHANHMNRTSNKEVILFYEDLVQPCVPIQSPVMNHSEVWGFDGILIATTVAQAISISKAPNSSKKVFYVWDLEWLREGKNDFLYNNQAYRNRELTLITRSQSHSDTLENYSNRKSDYIIPDIFLPQIVRVLE